MSSAEGFRGKEALPVGEDADRVLLILVGDGTSWRGHRDRHLGHLHALDDLGAFRGRACEQRSRPEIGEAQVLGDGARASDHRADAGFPHHFCRGELDSGMGVRGA